MFVRESVMLGSRQLTFETGRLAKQAHGSVLVTYGDTVVLVTAVCTDERPGLDFFPLTCEFVEKTYAAGRIPGGFFKREGRQREEEILTCRIIDRPLRLRWAEWSECLGRRYGCALRAPWCERRELCALRTHS